MMHLLLRFSVVVTALKTIVRKRADELSRLRRNLKP